MLSGWVQWVSGMVHLMDLPLYGWGVWTGPFRQTCVPCVVGSASPSQPVVSAKSIITMDVFIPTLVGIELFVKECISDTD